MLIGGVFLLVEQYFYERSRICSLIIFKTINLNIGGNMTFQNENKKTKESVEQVKSRSKKSNLLGLIGLVAIIASIVGLVAKDNEITIASGLTFFGCGLIFCYYEG